MCECVGITGDDVTDDTTGDVVVVDPVVVVAVAALFVSAFEGMPSVAASGLVDASGESFASLARFPEQSDASSASRRGRSARARARHGSARRLRRRESFVRSVCELVLL